MQRAKSFLYCDDFVYEIPSRITLPEISSAFLSSSSGFLLYVSQGLATACGVTAIEAPSSAAPQADVCSTSPSKPTRLYLIPTRFLFLKFRFVKFRLMHPVSTRLCPAHKWWHHIRFSARRREVLLQSRRPT